MNNRLAFYLGLFLIVTVKSDVRHPEKCQPKITGDTIADMLSKAFPCDPPRQTTQPPEVTTRDWSEQYLLSTDTRYDPKRSQEIAVSVLNLAQRITEDIINENKDQKYEIISPVSIASALQLALLGAHGATFNELMDLMEYNTRAFSQNPQQIHEEFGLLLEDLISNSPNPSRFRAPVPWRASASEEYVKHSMRYQSNQPNYDEHKISVANGIFVQRDFSIRDSFKEVVEGIYKSNIYSLDFRNAPSEAAKFINDWVNDKTHGKIKEIISGSTEAKTRVILANALYFKAEWQETFIDGVTSLKKFYPHGKDSDYSIMVDLMAHGGKFPHYYDPESDCEILGLPYKQNATTMYVILPKNSSTEKLKAAQKILTAEKIEKMINQMVIKTAVILFPKMHLTSGHCLKSTLRNLGLSSLFDPRLSDLSVLSEGLETSQLPNAVEKDSRNPPPFDPSGHLIFSRGGHEESNKKTKRDVSYKTESQSSRKENPLTVKDFMIRKRIVKKISGKKSHRSKREFTPTSTARLEQIRSQKHLRNPQLYAEEVIHKVDLTINEKGTEGGAATAITLNRSGTNVVFRVDTPFMFLIRHDPTHIPLFYGAVFEPEN